MRIARTIDVIESRFMLYLVTEKNQRLNFTKNYKIHIFNEILEKLRTQNLEIATMTTYLE